MNGRSLKSIAQIPFEFARFQRLTPFSPLQWKHFTTWPDYDQSHKPRGLIPVTLVIEITLPGP
jgi:hypothetical protein